MPPTKHCFQEKKKKIKPRGLPALSVLQNYLLSPQIQTQTTALERHF